jgi:acyl dehydratase
MVSEHPPRYDSEHYRFQLSQDDFNTFARLSGDHNPIHVDVAFSADTAFGRPVSHGMLLFSVLRGYLARQYPGAQLQSQNLMFPSPAYAGEPLELAVERLDMAGKGTAFVHLATRIIRADGETCLQGECRLALEQAADGVLR